MKKDLLHLPDSKQNELALISRVIQDSCRDVAMIILFGSYARGDYKEAKDLKPNRKSGHLSDYDILVITNNREAAESSMLWHQVAKKCSRRVSTTPIRIIAHDIDEVNAKLAYGQYFFRDIKNEGVMLFDTGDYKLAKLKDLTKEERLKVAKDYYDHWFGMAKEFWTDFNNAFARESFKKASFELNQATEHAYKTITLVFDDENPNEHFLSELKKMADELVPPLKSIFDWDDDKTKSDLFELLDYAYLGARYDAKFKIGKKDLETLAAEVKKLLDLVEEVCGERIGKI